MADTPTPLLSCISNALQDVNAIENRAQAGLTRERIENLRRVVKFAETWARVAWIIQWGFEDVGVALNEQRLTMEEDGDDAVDADNVQNARNARTLRLSILTGNRVANSVWALDRNIAVSAGISTEEGVLIDASAVQARKRLDARAGVLSSHIALGLAMRAHFELLDNGAIGGGVVTATETVSRMARMMTSQILPTREALNRMTGDMGDAWDSFIGQFAAQAATVETKLEQMQNKITKEAERKAGGGDALPDSITALIKDTMSSNGGGGDKGGGKGGADARLVAALTISSSLHRRNRALCAAVVFLRKRLNIAYTTIGFHWSAESRTVQRAVHQAQPDFIPRPAPPPPPEIGVAGAVANAVVAGVTAMANAAASIPGVEAARSVANRLPAALAAGTDAFVNAVAGDENMNLNEEQRAVITPMVMTSEDLLDDIRRSNTTTDAWYTWNRAHGGGGGQAARRNAAGAPNESPADHMKRVSSYFVGAGELISAYLMRCYASGGEINPMTELLRPILLGALTRYDVDGGRGDENVVLLIDGWIEAKNSTDANNAYQDLFRRVAVPPVRGSLHFSWSLNTATTGAKLILIYHLQSMLGMSIPYIDEDTARRDLFIFGDELTRKCAEQNREISLYGKRLIRNYLNAMKVHFEFHRIPNETQQRITIDLTTLHLELMDRAERTACVNWPDLTPIVGRVKSLSQIVYKKITGRELNDGERGAQWHQPIVRDLQHLSTATGEVLNAQLQTTLNEYKTRVTADQAQASLMGLETTIALNAAVAQHVLSQTAFAAVDDNGVVAEQDTWMGLWRDYFGSSSTSPTLAFVYSAMSGDGSDARAGARFPDLEQRWGTMKDVAAVSSGLFARMQQRAADAARVVELVGRARGSMRHLLDAIEDHSRFESKFQAEATRTLRLLQRPYDQTAAAAAPAAADGTPPVAPIADGATGAPRARDLTDILACVDDEGVISACNRFVETQTRVISADSHASAHRAVEDSLLLVHGMRNWAVMGNNPKQHLAATLLSLRLQLNKIADYDMRGENPVDASVRVDDGRLVDLVAQMQSTLERANAPRRAHTEQVIWRPAVAEILKRTAEIARATLNAPFVAAAERELLRMLPVLTRARIDNEAEMKQAIEFFEADRARRAYSAVQKMIAVSFEGMYQQLTRSVQDRALGIIGGILDRQDDAAIADTNSINVMQDVVRAAHTELFSSLRTSTAKFESDVSESHKTLTATIRSIDTSVQRSDDLRRERNALLAFSSYTQDIASLFYGLREADGNLSDVLTSKLLVDVGLNSRSRFTRDEQEARADKFAMHVGRVVLHCFRVFDAIMDTVADIMLFSNQNSDGDDTDTPRSRLINAHFARFTEVARRPGRTKRGMFQASVDDYTPAIRVIERAQTVTPPAPAPRPASGASLPRTSPAAPGTPSTRGGTDSGSLASRASSVFTRSLRNRTTDVTQHASVVRHVAEEGDDAVGSDQDALANGTGSSTAAVLSGPASRLPLASGRAPGDAFRARNAGSGAQPRSMDSLTYAADPLHWNMGHYLYNHISQLAANPDPDTWLASKENHVRFVLGLDDVANPLAELGDTSSSAVAARVRHAQSHVELSVLPMTGMREFTTETLMRTLLDDAARVIDIVGRFSVLVKQAAAMAEGTVPGMRAGDMNEFDTIDIYQIAFRVGRCSPLGTSEAKNTSYTGFDAARKAVLRDLIQVVGRMPLAPSTFDPGFIDGDAQANSIDYGKGMQAKFNYQSHSSAHSHLVNGDARFPRAIERRACTGLGGHAFPFIEYADFETIDVAHSGFTDAWRQCDDRMESAWGWIGATRSLISGQVAIAPTAYGPIQPIDMITEPRFIASAIDPSAFNIADTYNRVQSAGDDRKSIDTLYANATETVRGKWTEFLSQIEWDASKDAHDLRQMVAARVQDRDFIRNAMVTFAQTQADRQRAIDNQIASVRASNAAEVRRIARAASEWIRLLSRSLLTRIPTFIHAHSLLKDERAAVSNAWTVYGRSTDPPTGPNDVSLFELTDLLLADSARAVQSVIGNMVSGSISDGATAIETQNENMIAQARGIIMDAETYTVNSRNAKAYKEAAGPLQELYAIMRNVTVIQSPDLASVLKAATDIVKGYIVQMNEAGSTTRSTEVSGANRVNAPSKGDLAHFALVGDTGERESGARESSGRWRGRDRDGRGVADVEAIGRSPGTSRLEVFGAKKEQFHWLVCRLARWLALVQGGTSSIVSVSDMVLGGGMRTEGGLVYLNTSNVYASTMTEMESNARSVAVLDDGLRRARRFRFGKGTIDTDEKTSVSAKPIFNLTKATEDEIADQIATLAKKQFELANTLAGHLRNMDREILESLNEIRTLVRGPEVQPDALSEQGSAQSAKGNKPPPTDQRHDPLLQQTKTEKELGIRTFHNFDRVLYYLLTPTVLASLHSILELVASTGGRFTSAWQTIQRNEQRLRQHSGAEVRMDWMLTGTKVSRATARPSSARAALFAYILYDDRAAPVVAALLANTLLVSYLTANKGGASAQGRRGQSSRSGGAHDLTFARLDAEYESLEMTLKELSES